MLVNKPMEIVYPVVRRGTEKRGQIAENLLEKTTKLDKPC